MNRSSRQVLVTGGAGFIGSHLVTALLHRGHTVRVLDNFSTGRMENLESLKGPLDLVRGDIQDAGQVAQAARDVDLCFHLAAVSSVPQSVDDPLTTGRVNVQGTWHVLEGLRGRRIRRFVFISSASVYGERRTVPFRESLKLRGSSPYAASKLIGEELCDLYGRLYGLPWTAVRLFSVYGPRQNPRSQYANVIPAFATRVLDGVRPIVYGDGRQTRDFVFVEDVVRALSAAAGRRAAVGRIINVGSGRQTSVLRLLSMIQKTLGTNLKPKYEPRKPGDDPRTCADTRLCRDLLGIERVTPLDAGLARTLEWFRHNRNR